MFDTDDESGINVRESAEKKVEVVGTCNKKKRGVCRKSCDGNGSAGDEEVGKT